MRKGETIKTRKETSYTPIAILAILFVSMFTAVPANAFIHPDGSFDSDYELFGPHVDQIRFQRYSSTDAMLQAMDQGLIDLCDWPLTATWRTTFASNPDVNMVNAGSEAGFFTIDFNEDPYAIVPNSTRPGYENPVYTKPTQGYPLGIPPISTNVHFRWACLRLFNRFLFQQVLGPQGWDNYQILTPVPPYMGDYIWPAPAPAPAPDYVAATAELNAGQIYKTNTGVWYWDYDGSGQINSPPQNEIDAAKIVMTWRQDTFRAQAGVQLYTELQAMGFTVDGKQVTGGQNYQQVMLDKNYHITTLGWINIGPDPDYLYDLYHGHNFWDDPESACPNTADLNDTMLNELTEGIKFALTPEAALTATLDFQARFYAICAQIPLYSSVRWMASSKYYTGGNDGVKKVVDDGENQYRLKNQEDPASRREWLGFCNQAGIGSNSWFSYLNGYPDGTMYGDGQDMTLRYGWSSQDHPERINPFYSESYCKGLVVGAMYDSLGCRDPYDPSKWTLNLAENWTVGTWTDVVDGGKIKSKVTVTLRPDVYWSDGIPMTIADVKFSLVDSARLLIKYGNAPPWWWPTADLVNSWKELDGYNFEILYDVQSQFAEDWTLGGFYIVPEHIWRPLIESGMSMNTFAPDPDCICSGPFRYLQYTPLTSLVMVANTPGRTITTDQPGAVPMTSTQGYFKWHPIDLAFHIIDPPELAHSYKVPQANYVEALDIINLFERDDTVWGLTIKIPSSTGPLESVVVDGTLPLGPLEKATPLNISFTAGDITKTKTLHYAECTTTLLGIPVWEHVWEMRAWTGSTHDETVGYGTNWTDTGGTQHEEIQSRTINCPANQWTTISQVTFKFWGGGKVGDKTGSLADPIWWYTIPEDIAGSTLYDDIGWSNYTYKSKLPTPDCKVSGYDIALASWSFGSFPGHPRWNSICDVNGNYKIDGSDVARIAQRFGWPSGG